MNRVKEYGFPFKGDMVRAMLSGRKTMTRRIPSHMNCIVDGKRVNKEAWSQLDIKNGTLTKELFLGDIYLLVQNISTKDFHAVRPIYEQGNRFWVRENGWERPFRTDKMIRDGADTWLKYYYDADLTNEDHEQFKAWGFKRRPSIHMPRHFSRIDGVMTQVKFEFLQDINRDDALREGIIAETFYPDEGYPLSIGYTYVPGDVHKIMYTKPEKAFEILWDSIYGNTEFAWKENNPIISIGLSMEVPRKTK